MRTEKMKSLTVSGKALIIMAFAVVLMYAVMPMALADEANSSEEAPEVIDITLESEEDSSQTIDSTTSAEINDDLSGSASSTDIALIKVKNWLTFNQEKKAELELKIARLELVKARIAAQNNNTVAMEKSIEAHNRIMEKIQSRIEKIDGASTREGIKKSAEKLVGLERAIQVHEAKISRLNEIVANSNLSEEQIEIIQTRIEHMENVTAHLKNVEIAKKDTLKTRLMAVAEMNESDASYEIRQIERARNMTAVKRHVAEIKEARAEKASQTLTNVITKLEERANETGNNNSAAIAKLTIARDRMQARVAVSQEVQARNRNAALTTEATVTA